MRQRPADRQGIYLATSLFAPTDDDRAAELGFSSLAMSATETSERYVANVRFEPIVKNAAQSPHIRFGQYAELETGVSLRVVAAGLAREFIPERAERGACT